ncbi:MAG: hypothetical protein GDA54_05945 [Alphaproteobacteria bacterium GM7ARS4]|nr:hypothetical protein [Alphaproteobacteria bacterium GM7ARS4]
MKGTNQRGSRGLLVSSSMKAEEVSPPHYIGHRQRQYEKFLGGEPSSLYDYEILELLLFYLYPRGDVKPLAKALLKDVPLGRLIHAKTDHYATLSAQTGKATTESSHPVRQFLANTRRRTLFALVAEISRRLSIDTLQKHHVPIATIDQLIHYLRTSIGHKKEEHFTILYLNKNNDLIEQTTQKKHTPSRPTLTQNTISQNDPHAVNISAHALLRQAILYDASAVILAHNHPSGKASPSTQDITMTKNMCEKLHAINVVLHDHIIITPYDAYSMKEHGLF